MCLRDKQKEKYGTINVNITYSPYLNEGEDVLIQQMILLDLDEAISKIADKANKNNIDFPYQKFFG